MFKLQFHRIKKDLSRSALSRMSGVHYHTISQIESGRVNPTQQELDALGVALGVDPAQLLVGIDDTPLGPGAESRDQQQESGE